MKIDSDTSTLFVKQDLFANPSAKKASNATGKELDNVLIVDRNQTDRDIFGDSYSVELNGQKINANATRETITFNGDYAWWTATSDDTVASIETFVSAALGATKNPVTYADYMTDLARSLNSYMRFQSDDYNPEDDSYMQSIIERFDSLDPEQQDSRINQMRNMIKTAQSGMTIHVDDDKFIKKVNESFPNIDENPITSTKNINKKTNNTFSKSNAKSYQITMNQIQNSASLLSKLLDKDDNQQQSTSLDNILHFSTDNQDSSEDITDKKRKLKYVQQDNDKDKTDTTTESHDTKAKITSFDWNTVSKNYADAHSKKLPLLNLIYTEN